VLLWCHRKASHDVHHVSTNSLSHDPDIQHMPLFAYNKGLFASLYSTFHERVMPYDKMCRFMVRLPLFSISYLFWPWHLTTPVVNIHAPSHSRVSSISKGFV
jgi:hypothetical protein